MNPEVRSATPGDSERLASLWLAWGREYEDIDPVLFRVPSEAGLVDWFARHIATSRDDDLWLVGIHDGEVQAFERAVIWRPNEDAERSLVVDDALTTLKVASLFVAPTARRHGFGVALTTEAETWGRSRGAERAIVVAMTDGPTAVPFYRSQGFHPLSTGLWKPLT